MVGRQLRCPKFLGSLPSGLGVDAASATVVPDPPSLPLVVGRSMPDRAFASSSSGHSYTSYRGCLSCSFMRLVRSVRGGEQYSLLGRRSKTLRHSGFAHTRSRGLFD